MIIITFLRGETSACLGFLQRSLLFLPFAHPVTRVTATHAEPGVIDDNYFCRHAAAAGGRRRRMPSASSLKKRIPVRTSGDVKDLPLGMLEIDLVCHGGETMAGSFVHSLVLTDHATGWTECVPLLVRDSALVVEAIANVRARLPFVIRGLDSDNGSEFINELLVGYCEENSIELTRSRPYQKNDQAGHRAVLQRAG